MAEAPTPEDLEALREYLAELRKSNAEAAKAKDDEASAARRTADAESLLREIAFEEQAKAILDGVPPESSEEVSNEPPDNSTVSNDPPANTEPPAQQTPQINLGGGTDDENGE